jgi:hypothetical protein
MSEFFGVVGFVSFFAWMGGMISSAAYPTTVNEDRFYAGMLVLSVISTIIGLITL